jgi:hypothetical protein
MLGLDEAELRLALHDAQAEAGRGLAVLAGWHGEVDLVRSGRAGCDVDLELAVLVRLARIVVEDPVASRRADGAEGDGAGDEPGDEEPQAWQGVASAARLARPALRLAAAVWSRLLAKPAAARRAP